MNSGKYSFIIERKYSKDRWEVVGQMNHNPVRDKYSFYDLKPAMGESVYKVVVYQKNYGKDKAAICEKTVSLPSPESATKYADV